jgi:hypothetical protein
MVGLLTPSSRFKFLASFEEGPWFTYSNGCQKVGGRETSLRLPYLRPRKCLVFFPDAGV